MATIDRYKVKVDVDGANQIKDLDSSLATAQKRLTQFGAAGVAALTALGVSAIRTAKQVSDLAGTAGFTSGEIFQMGVSAERAGGSFDQVGTMLLRFSNSVEQAAEGNDRMRRSFERIGVSAQELETLDDQQLFRRVVQGLGAMEDGAEKTALSIQLLGRQAATTDLRQFGEDLNRAVDPALERRLENAAQLVRTIGAAFRELQMAALAAMDPIISKLNEFEFNADTAQKVIQVLGALTAAAFSAATVLGIVRTIAALRTLAITIRTAATAQALLTGLIPGIGAATVIAAIAGATFAYNQLGKAIGDASDSQQELNDALGAGAEQAASATQQQRELRLTTEDRLIQSVRRTNEELIRQSEIERTHRDTVRSTIGLEQNRAQLIRANADAQRQARQQILALEREIQVEQAKGSEASQEVIQQLIQRHQIILDELETTKELNKQEFIRAKTIRQQQIDSELALENLRIQNSLARETTEIDLMRQRIRGEINEEQMRHAQNLANLEVDHAFKMLDFEERLAQAELRNDEEEMRRLRGLMSLEEQRFKEASENLKELRRLQEELNQSFVAGTVSAMTQLAEQFKPYRMAQDAILQGWNRIGEAIDTFVETGKFKFKDFARSVLQDLLKMIIRAQVFAAIQSTMGVFGMAIPGLAKGGPAQANQPYIVGEEGPELFVPKSAGTVIPNDRLMGMNQSQPAATMSQPAVNNFITNNISALDSKSVAQVFAENRQALLGSVQVAQRELPF